MIADIIIIFVGIVFIFNLLPQVYDCLFRHTIINLITGVSTSIGLFLLALSYALLGCEWLVCLPNVLAGILWAVIAFSSYKNKKNSF